MISALLAGLLWLAAAHLPVAAQQAAPVAAAPTQDATVPDFVPGELVVGFYAGHVAAASPPPGVDLRAAQTLDTGGIQAAVQGEPVVMQVVPVAPGQELAIADELAANPAVAFAHPNWIVYAADASPETAYGVDDPLYADEQWYLQRIGASRAWATAFDSAAVGAVRVAIIDSGIDADHPELTGRVDAGRNYTDVPMADECGHGTHIAGLVGATLNNGAGIAGLSPQARLTPYKVLRWTSFGTSAACAGPVSGLVSAIYAAVADFEAHDDSARIINMSLEISSDSPSLRTAVSYASSRGVLMIAAAGNRGSSSVAYPARYQEVMAVAATTYADRRAYYSNMGDEIEIAAPGGDGTHPIFGAWSSDAVLRCSGYTVEDGGGYCNASGTSMAAGLVTGAAALLWSMAPGLSANQVRAALRDSATPLGLDPRMVGSGRLNVQGAVRRTVPSDLTVSQEQVSLSAAPGDPPRAVVLRLANPSADPIDWTATVLADRPWLALASTATGQASYGEPGYVTLAITPTLATGAAPTTQIQITGNQTNGSVVFRTVSVELVLTGTASHTYFAPLLAIRYGPQAASSWEVPVHAADRTYLAMTDSSDLAIDLPFDFALGGQEFATARVYSDGFVAFPAADVSPALPNRCLGNASSPQHAVYGWWADLDPGDVAASVSTFQPAADRFVVEFQDVPAGAGAPAPAPYRVTFQIILYADGRVGLNYEDTPAAPGAAAVPVTVGVESRDGRFYNQVTCVDGDYDLSVAPAPFQRFLILPEELY